MEKEEVIRGNKLISKFMGFYDGWAHHEEEEGRTLPPYRLTEPKPFTKFHTEWNWIMRVVEKIETLEEKDRQVKSADVLCTPYRVDILGRNVVEVLAFGEDSICLINQNGLTKMEALYKAVVGFIKFYNERGEKN